jgi:predicted TIM-barrel enzyme
VGSYIPFDRDRQIPTFRSDVHRTMSDRSQLQREVNEAYSIQVKAATKVRNTYGSVARVIRDTCRRKLKR